MGLEKCTSSMALTLLADLREAKPRDPVFMLSKMAHITKETWRITKHNAKKGLLYPNLWNMSEVSKITYFTEKEHNAFFYKLILSMEFTKMVRKSQEQWNGVTQLSNTFMKVLSIKTADSQEKVWILLKIGKLTDPEGIYEGQF